ncbi:MAG TPA: hypothetical protein VKU41_15625, partial [Polyangiaceae bacterium]|nr:hypothetical protein [Polyangiaceae bacterium]
MSSGNTRASLQVRVPSPNEDRPAWKKVAAVTAVGFLLGVVWPRVAGVRLGPSVPESPSASASAPAPPAEASPLPPASVLSAPSAVSAPAAPTPAAAAPAAPPSHALSVGHGTIISCKSADGVLRKAADCGALGGLDAAVMPRLRRMADCPEGADD